MSDSSEWQAALVRVLEADTADLRELATLAGADPRTLYIGTRLDGVDVRGQDLRGMNLADMDRSRVRHDDSTLFDDHSIDLPLVYLSEPDVDPTTLGRLSHWTPFIIREEEAVGFIKAARVHQGPVFILAWGPPSRVALGTARTLESAGIQHLMVVVEDVRSLKKAIDLGELQLGNPLLSVPTGASMLGFRRKVVTPESRDAMRIIAEHWADRARFFNGKDAWFLRARGAGPEPQLDAAGQIFDRAVGLSLSTEGLTVTGPRPPGRPGVDIDKAVMKLLRVKGVASTRPVSARPDYHLGAFGTRKRSEMGSRYYHDTTLKALRSRGWSGEVGPTTRRHMFMENELSRFQIEPDDGHRRLRTGTAPGDVVSFDFHQVQSVVVSERADLSMVVDRLFTKRQLWVTSRDLLASPPDRVSLWLLLAAQLRRVSRAMGGQPRKLYLELLLRQAMRDGGLSVEEGDPLKLALSSTDFSEHHDLSLSGLDVQGYGTAGRLRITPLGYQASPLAGRAIDLHLKIDPDGVEVTGRLEA